MRYILAGILVIHGIAHLAGVRRYGLHWLALALGFGAVAVGVARRSPWWLLTLEIFVICSAVFCVLGWPETRFGLAANALVIVLAWAAIHLSSGLAIRDRHLDQLWDSAPQAQSTARIAQAVRLRMHGDIKLGRWYPFQAEQVITRDGQFVWAATVSMFGIPIRGYDRILNGQGSMRWMLADVIPVMVSSGPDVTRSALGRLHGEQACWLPPSSGRLWCKSAGWTRIEEWPVLLRSRNCSAAATSMPRSWCCASA
ncbi:MAG: hypothetical protein FJW39_18120, partial [Acidobacteria bacterium]|nr:hypothetical protein [Acidobacteriota bacterium]